MHQRAWLSILTFPLVATFTYPVVFRQALPSVQIEARQGPQDPLSGLSDIQDVLSLVKDHYVDSTDMEKVVNGGIVSALERAHPLNAYVSPEELRLLDPGPAQVGLTVLRKNIWAQVLAVSPGSPAAKAGIQPGDVIRKVDGESVGALSAWMLERKLRGLPGTEITVVHYASIDGQLKKVSMKRELPARRSILLKKDTKATLIGLPDLAPGRALEFKALLGDLDRKFPLVLDLRNCVGGELSEAALVAGLLGGDGKLATVQEVGKPDRIVSVVKNVDKTVDKNVDKDGESAFSKIAIVQDISTVGAGETLVSLLKKQTVFTVGERTAGLGVERSRILLKQGGAVELVNRRWLGADGEKLDRQGVTPEQSLKNVQTLEDPLPKVLELLANRPKKVARLTSGKEAKPSPVAGVAVDDEAP